MRAAINKNNNCDSFSLIATAIGEAWSNELILHLKLDKYTFSRKLFHLNIILLNSLSDGFNEGVKY